MNHSTYIEISTIWTTKSAEAAMIARMIVIVQWLGVSVDFVGAIISIVTNFIILFVMPGTKDVNKKARAVYTSVAFADLVILIGGHLLMTWQISLRVIPAPYWLLELVSPAACKINHYFHYSWQAISNMLIAVFNLERCVAVALPFTARKFTFRRTLVMIAFIVLLTFAIEGGLLYIYDLHGKAFDFDVYCNVQPVPHSSDLLTLSLAMAYVVPIVLMLFSNCTMYIVLKCRDSRAHSGGQKRKLSNSARVTVIMSVIHFVIYAPFGILYITSISIVPGFVATMIRGSSYAFLYFVGYVSAANFVIYIVNIQGFKNRLLCRKVP